MNRLRCWLRGHCYDSLYGIEHKYNLELVSIEGAHTFIKIRAGSFLKCRCGKEMWFEA